MLNQLQQRNKLMFSVRNLRLGDVVLLRDDISPPTQWPLAIITELHPGKDGLVRVVKVRTAKSEFTRGIENLIYLPTDEECEQCYSILKSKKC